EEEELALEAPKRETADELLDAGGANPLDPMRHSAAHVMAEAVMDLFPETKGQPYKVEIVDDLVANAEAKGLPAPKTTFYQQGPFIDLCRGPHVESTGKIGPFKLLAVSGAYWRGDQKRPSMQRVYGTAWKTQEELDHFLWRREEAKK